MFVCGHEIAHGVGKMPRWLRRSLELIGWTFTIFATATSQRRAHNVAHHRHTNTPHDPDRRLNARRMRKDWAYHPSDGVAGP